MNIFLISSHPVDYELTDAWIRDGHTVNLITHQYSWNDQFSGLNPNVLKGIPKKEPDLIVCEAMKDLRWAYFLKYTHFWFKVKVVKLNLWYPYKIFFLKRSVNVSVCEYARKKLYAEQKVESSLAYCPVDTEFFDQTNATKEKKAIIIGNGFKERKIMGYDHLLKILETVHQKDPEIKLAVIGINSRDVFPEYVDCKSLPKEQLKQEINSSSCVFFTTTENLIMNSMQIAMSCCSNVIAFDLEPFREVIEDQKSGILVPKFNDEIFAEKVVNYSSNYDEVMGRNARESVVSKCDKFLVSRKIIEAGMTAK